MDAVERYLDTGPWDGSKFRREMKRVGYCVSGSRAQRFPGWMRDAKVSLCAPPHSSDWDIYTDGTVVSIGETLRSLEGFGVKFDSPLGSLETQIEQSMQVAPRALHIGAARLGMLHRNWENLKLHNHNFNFPFVDNLFEKLDRKHLEFPLKRKKEKFRQHYIAISKTETLLLVVYAPRACVRPPGVECENEVGGSDREQDESRYQSLGLTVIEGKAKDGTAVQVIAKPNETVEAVIMQFHSTAVECFLGGRSAGHLYGKMMSRNQSYFWPGNRQSPVKALQAKKKYEQRGVEYVGYPYDTLETCKECHSNHKIRNLSDGDAILFRARSSYHRASVPPLELEWLEDGDRTRLINPRKLELSPQKPNAQFWLYVNSLPYSSQILKS